MKIGLKFCGGCNPYYDRSQAVEEFVKKFPQFSFEIVREEEPYQVILLVCGCQRACIGNYREASATEYIILRKEEDFKGLAAFWAKRRNVLQY